jgi:molybdopterin-guanine dinucleotide biosynthesis protein A
MSKVDGYVLTGGASTRMGRDKSRLDFGGETLAERATRTLAAVCSNVFTVGGEPVRDIPLVEDEFELSFPGQKAAIAGLVSALKHSQTEWTAILACDLPFVTSALFRLLISKTSAAPKKASVIVPVQSDDKLQPLCAVYRTAVSLSEAIAAVSIGNFKIRKLVERLDPVTIEFNELAVLCETKDPFVNINTPEDFQKALEQHPLR